MTPIVSAPTIDAIILDAEQSSRVKIMHKTAGITLGSIQSLRAIAALLVVLFHAHDSFYSSYSTASFNNQAYVFGFGKVGLHIFFVISGYIMYRTSFGLRREFDAKAFILKRFLRVYPVYWVFVLMYVAAAFVLMSPPKLSTAQSIGMVLLLPGAAPLLIGPAWTLSYEIYFYVVFAAAMLLGRLRGMTALTAFLCSVWLSGQSFDPMLRRPRWRPMRCS